MRPGSADDARWAKGLARAWDLPLVSATVDRAPANETEARRARYRFLEEARAETGSHWVLTALTRTTRPKRSPTGPARHRARRLWPGFPATRAPGLYRRCCPFGSGNWPRLRLGLSPPAPPDRPHQSVAGSRAQCGARGNCCLAERERIAPGRPPGLHPSGSPGGGKRKGSWRAVIPTLLAGLGVRRSEGRVSFSRDALLRYDPLVRARVIRALAAEAGAHLDAHTTDLASEFASSGASGRSLDLPGGVVLSRSFERLLLSRAARTAPQQEARDTPASWPFRLPARARPRAVREGRSSSPAGRRGAPSGERGCPSRRCAFPSSFATGGPATGFALPPAAGSSRKCSVMRGCRGPRARADPCWRMRAAASSGCRGWPRSIEARPAPEDAIL